jgi:hypothetical protein
MIVWSKNRSDCQYNVNKKLEEEERYELDYPRQLSHLEIIIVGIRVMLLLQLMLINICDPK